MTAKNAQPLGRSVLVDTGTRGANNFGPLFGVTLDALSELSWRGRKRRSPLARQLVYRRFLPGNLSDFGR